MRASLIGAACVWVAIGIGCAVAAVDPEWGVWRLPAALMVVIAARSASQMYRAARGW